MHRLSKSRMAVVTFLTILSGFTSNSFAGSRPNVLFIAVDDLRPELGCYGDSHIHSPNIDALAASGRRFERAYCQQAVCNPSRTSLMTGMRPDSIGVTGNHSHFRTNHPDVVTLPQHFMRHGYHAAAIGKIYHGVFPDGASITKWDTMGDPQSWSVPAIRFGPRYYYTEEGIAAAKSIYERVYRPKNPGPDDWTKKLVFGPATEAPDIPDSTLYDGQVADAAVKTLQQLKGTDKPFFLAVGFIKPHSPYIAPKKYFDLYKDVALPPHPGFPANAPSFAGHGSGELRRYTDQPKSGVISDEKQRRVRHAYYACISYIDAQIGRVLDELDRSGLSENTIVVLYGDHGYHLGEQGLWGKTTNFELDTRVPLIVRAPNMKAAGKPSSSLVELVDLYPTLAELAGLPITGQLEGKSFAGALNDPKQVIKTIALSQYPRGRGLMGYSMRTPTHRLTHWVHRQSGEIRETELYDYAGGLIETENLASDAQHVVEQLTAELEVAFALNLVKPENIASVSFEETKPGPFEKLDTQVGTWTPDVGRTIVDDKHAKTGKHCLQLTGGKQTSVILQLADTVDASGALTFWAERWTVRKPFSFRIDKHNGKGWQEIYNGDASVRVGRSFLNHVKIPLGDEKIEQLRFTVTSPPNTGMLIDDLRIAPARPQKIVGVEVAPLTLPALAGTDASPLLKLKVVTSGSLDPLSMTDMQITLHGDKGPADFTKLFVHPNKWEAKYAERPWLISIPAVDLDGTGLKNRTYRYGTSLAASNFSLAEGDNTVWISCRLKEDANIDHRVGTQIREVKFSNGQTFKLDTPPSIQRLGVAVRKGGDDGVHTYRIPGLTTTNKGTLIGVYDVRRRSGGDLPGDIDVGMSRSTDGGRTWEPMKIIMDMGDDPDWRYDGIGDPAVLVDKNTGTIWVAATWSHGNRSWRGSGPGVKPEEAGQLMLVRSDDDGVTWSKPINITEQVKKPEWCFILQGPGKGITMRDGTIVFAAQYQDPPEQKRLPHSTIIYSKDHGRTWQVGTGAFDDTTESQVVEIEPGVLMLNCRYNRRSVRVVMTTRDMGKTWQKHTTSERSLIEPGSCMASLIDVDQEVGKDVGKWLLFSNPDSTRGRHHITIKASPDRGLTWPKQHRLLLDEGNSAGYSCMSMIDEKTVGILYEGSRAHMTFQRIPLSELVDEKAVRRTSQSVESPSNKATDKDFHRTLELPRVFGSQMVLQADSEIPVWGTTKPGEKVTVELGSERRVTFANDSGNWKLRLQERKASAAPIVMSIYSGGESIKFKDILIGEVWVCAGQSNMEWTLCQSANAKKELAAADHPNLRLLHLVASARGSSGSYGPDHLSRLKPWTFCEGEWKVASAESAGSFSAVAWYFGRHLQQQLNVPVGLICPAVGGTPAEAWIPRSALSLDPIGRGLVAGNWLDNQRLGEFCRTRGHQNLLAAIQAGESIPGDEFGPNHSFKPGFMWDAGIKPLIPFAIRGAIWYQGESNAETPARVREHGQLFPLLINQWRKQWGQGDFPFLYVQLPALNRPEWPWFRDGQRRTLSQLKNVGMAIAIDTGHPSNVHPTLKKPVGERLAKWALGTTYKSKLHATYSGPLLDVAEREGDSMVVSFNHVGDGLKSSDGKPLRHLEVCGKDGVFHPASAKIIGRNTIAVSSPKVAEPHDVRYAWLPYPNSAVNLFNSVGLPASPLTTESTETVFARRTAASQRPNILFIVSEDNSEHLGCYGERRVHTPHLDALAAGGVRYTRAYVPYSVCSPSRAAFLTGLYTRQTGHIGLATHRFSMYRDFKTMPARFQQAGYYTGFLGKAHINPEGLVDNYVDHRAIQNSNFGKTISIETYAEEAGVVMQNAAESKKPFLLIINYADAHRRFVGKSKHGFPTQQVTDAIAPFPWIGSDTPHLREELRDYFNCMNRLDEGVGMVLDKLDETGIRDNTLVVYISDHGADFPRGKGSIYENGTRIPMIVNYPKSFPKGKVENGMVSTIDILPTMLRAARLPIPENLPGFALQDIDSGKSPPRKYIHTFTTGSSPNLLYMQFGIRDDRYKLVYNPDRALNRLAESRYRNSQLPEDQHVQSFLHPPEYELFDLQEDPHEWKNLADSAEHKPIRQRLLKAMQSFQREIKDPFASRENIATFIAEQKEYLNKPYKKPGFRWPHLDMFKKAQEVSETDPSRQTIFQQRAIPEGTPLEGHAKDAKLYGYRIPSLLVTKKGSILAFSERRLGLHDHAQNDIVLRRSADGGKTWGDEIVAYEDGMNSINDPLTVQLENGRILLMFARFPYGRHARDAGWIKMADLGYDDPTANVLTFVCHSDDDGQTWSQPVDISRQVKHPKLLNANTPGAMIQLTKGPHKGRVVTGLWGTLPIMKDGKRSREWQIVVAYSDDNGQSWKRTEPLEDKSEIGFPNECQVAEAGNGDIVLISRNQGGERFRKKAISHDGGETWSPLDIDRTLPSVACMGSVIKGPVQEDGTWDLWASFPSNAGRKDGQIAVSKDNGKTWHVVKIIHGPFAYSALQVSPDQSSLLCLYESDGYRIQNLITMPLDEIEEVAEAGDKPSRPNVVFIMVDDLGWSDVGFNGSTVYETPNVDRLARQGMVLSDFYSGGPVCSPTRASVMTGKYTARTGITTYLISPTRDAKHVQPHLPLEEFTIAEAFKKNGYATGYFGKWHLGYESDFWAGNQGFDVAKGGIDLPWAWTLCYPDIKEAPTAKTWPKSHTRFFSPYHLTHLENGTDGEYLTERLTNETIDFIETHRDEPFFAFLSFHTVHTPLQAKLEKIEKYKKKIAALGLDAKKEKNRREKAFQNNAAYGAMVEHMDENVGRLLARLDELNLSDNTIVVWTSDNGGKGSVTSNLPLRGMKHNLYEGGIRVPTIFRWPKRIAAGTKNATPLISNDFYPTLLELTSCPAEPQQHVDGVSFASVLLGKSESVDRDAIYWHYPHSRKEAAVREGRYKLLHRFEQDRVELYDLQADIGERTDLSAEKPEVAQRLLGKLKSWQKSVGAKFEGDVVKRNAVKPSAAVENSKSRPNVLFISVDDWNDWVGCLGHGQAQTPNTDRLASRGLLFTNAHCVAPVCNPSRVATLTGLRPDTTGVYENNQFMRRMVPDVVTLPQYFRANGYHVAGGGKVFHDVPPHCHDPLSWDEYFWWNEHGPKGGRSGSSWRSPYSIPPDPQPDGRPTRKITPLTKRNFEWGAVDQPESDWPDSKVTAWATEFLSRDHTKPFFLAVGIFRPHVPWFNPRNYVEKYPLDRITLPTVKADDLDDLGRWAKRRAHDRISKHDQLVEFGEWKPAVQAYLASISFADANVGRVLDALEKSPHRDNTIVVFWSDHGYHLGEKGHWHKRTLWERSTHVPFVVVAPGVTKPGTKCSRPVSLLDIYPTLISLCGLDGRKQLEGNDLSPLLSKPKSKWEHAAVTTWQPDNHSVRTEDWRYIRYSTGEEELYDHRADLNEWDNLAAKHEFAKKKLELAKRLPALRQKEKATTSQ